MFSREDADGSALWLLSDAIVVTCTCSVTFVILEGSCGGAGLVLVGCFGLAPVAVDVGGFSLSSALIFSASARYACLFGIIVASCCSLHLGVAALSCS